MIDLYTLLLLFILSWNLNFFLEAITSFFLETDLTILRFIYLFKVEKEKEAYGEKYLEWNFLLELEQN